MIEHGSNAIRLAYITLIQFVGIHCIYSYLFEVFLNISHEVRRWALGLGVGRSTLSSPNAYWEKVGSLVHSLYYSQGTVQESHRIVSRK
jgi:hypothetical protein